MADEHANSYTFEHPFKSALIWHAVKMQIKAFGRGGRNAFKTKSERRLS
ncbi:hypothetical protein DNHGIG_32480 [Collibacillus ludicampi]|uniref:Transposase n=1 Tax=Collibacillus ludicampi TaxID=2771369 RepID=A0AAV4LIP1_9BACL|nr:hypothetical protein DNHGIG_32480 [Collibacillus ludicampi]